MFRRAVDGPLASENGGSFSRKIGCTLSTPDIDGLVVRLRLLVRTLGIPGRLDGSGNLFVCLPLRSHLLLTKEQQRPGTFGEDFGSLALFSLPLSSVSARGLWSCRTDTSVISRILALFFFFFCICSLFRMSPGPFFCSPVSFNFRPDQRQFITTKERWAA